MLTLSSQTWTAWHPKQLAATASRTAYVKSWVPILLWENGSSRNKQDYRGVSLKDEHVCRVRCHVVFVLTSNDVEMESVLTWRFRLSLPKFSKPSLKGWRPMLEEQGWSSLWVHCWLQGQPQNHQDPPGQFFNKLSLLHFFVGSRAALCLVRWRAGHLRFPQLFARVPVPLSFGLRNCHTESSNKCEPYDFAVNGQGGVVEVILTFLESVGFFWCAIYLRFVLSSFIPSLWALEYHWISLLFVTTAGSIGLLCPYVRWLSSQVMHLIPSMSETQWEFQMPRDTGSGFPASKTW